MDFNTNEISRNNRILRKTIKTLNFLSTRFSTYNKHVSNIKEIPVRKLKAKSFDELVTNILTAKFWVLFNVLRNTKSKSELNHNFEKKNKKSMAK